MRDGSSSSSDRRPEIYQTSVRPPSRRESFNWFLQPVRGTCRAAHRRRAIIRVVAGPEASGRSVSASSAGRHRLENTARRDHREQAASLAPLSAPTRAARVDQVGSIAGFVSPYSYYPPTPEDAGKSGESVNHRLRANQSHAVRAPLRLDAVGARRWLREWTTTPSITLSRGTELGCAIEPVLPCSEYARTRSASVSCATSTHQHSRWFITPSEATTSFGSFSRRLSRWTWRPLRGAIVSECCLVDHTSCLSLRRRAREETRISALSARCQMLVAASGEFDLVSTGAQSGRWPMRSRPWPNCRKRWSASPNVMLAFEHAADDIDRLAG